MIAAMTPGSTSCTRAARAIRSRRATTSRRTASSLGLHAAAIPDASATALSAAAHSRAGRELTSRNDERSALLRLARRQYLPNLEAFARYSYQDNVPFLARNFGTFGVHFGYDLFDGGKRNAEISERRAQLAQAEENLARVKDEIELRIQTIYNKRERTREMLKVSE